MKNKVLPVYWWVIDYGFDERQLTHICFDFRKADKDLNIAVLSIDNSPVFKKSNFIEEKLNQVLDCFSNAHFLKIDYCSSDFNLIDYYIDSYVIKLKGSSLVNLSPKIIKRLKHLLEVDGTIYRWCGNNQSSAKLFIWELFDKLEDSDE